MKLSLSVILGSLLFVAVVGRLEAASIVNGGFEVAEIIETVLPSTFGDWSGDGGSIVISENGITPLGGNRMLKFDETFLGAHSSAVSGDVHHLVDMSALSTEIDAGLVSVWASASFNRIVGDSQTDTQFSISARAYDGLPDAYDDNSPGIIPNLGSETATIFSDADLSTWELAMVNLSVPAGTTYLGIGVSAKENIFNDTTAPEFDGHYADDVALTVHIIPEPACEDGDINGDGAINAIDAGIMFTNFGQVGLDCEDGNIVSGGADAVDAADAGTMFANWTGDPGPSLVSAAVPEPTSLSLATLALIGMGCRRRKRA